MVSQKKSSNISSKNTSKKSNSSRIQVDGIYKKRKLIEVEYENYTNSSNRGGQHDSKDATSVDDNRRLFLKAAGVAGLGLAAGALFPKGAEAYVAGSTPTSNVVGVKDSTNARIDPATQATLATRASEATLAAMKAKTDLLTFDGSNNLLTASSGGASSVKLKDTSNTEINPATEDSLILLRRILRQMDSLAVVDSAQRQKVTVEGATITSGTITTVTTVSTVTSATNLVALGGVDGRYLHIDTARNASANGIRANLIFS